MVENVCTLSDFEFKDFCKQMIKDADSISTNKYFIRDFSYKKCIPFAYAHNA